MKVRITGLPEEFELIMPALMKHRNRFTGWRKPQKGTNPKYANNPQMLQYLEIDVADLIHILSKGKK